MRIKWVFNSDCICEMPLPNNRVRAQWWTNERNRNPRPLRFTLYNHHRTTPTPYMTRAYDDAFEIDRFMAGDDANNWWRNLRLMFCQPEVLNYWDEIDRSRIEFRFSEVWAATNAVLWEDEPVPHYLLWEATTTETVFPYQYIYSQGLLKKTEGLTWTQDGF